MRCLLTDAPFEKKPNYLPNLKKDVSYLTISDIHLFNDQNHTDHITKSLMDFMDGYSSGSRFAKLDIIFIAGDIFDDTRDTKHPDNFSAHLWMSLLMEFCKRHGIKLRILEGTPGHDYGQAKTFRPLAAGFGPELDFKYIEFLSFEKMEDLGLTILYVPDEWAGSAAVCKEQIIKMMEENDIEMFDIACMHGMFDFQIPELGEHILKHDSEWYLSIVRAFINIGHDHKPKFHFRIIIQGSFDRMAHGEEHPKGGVVCYLQMDGHHRFEFIENKNARIFKTITVKTNDLEKAVEQVSKALSKLPLHSHVRISTSKTNPILGILEEFKRAHPTLKFKKHEDKKQSDNPRDALSEAVSLVDTYVSVSLTKLNIIDMVLDNLSVPLTDEDKAVLLPELEVLL